MPGYYESACSRWKCCVAKLVWCRRCLQRAQQLPHVVDCHGYTSMWKTVIIRTIIGLLCVAVFAVWLGHEYDAGHPFELGIDIDSCQPHGIRAHIQRAWNPLDFWVTQDVDLNYWITEARIDPPQDYCKFRVNANQKEISQCIQYYATRRAKRIKCLDYVARLCRIHGGNCPTADQTPPF